MKNLFKPALLVVALSGVLNAVSANPWNKAMTDVEPIKVLDPKAVQMLSVAKGSEPVFEITIEDIGLYFGYLIPAHVAGFETTRIALDLLYPNGMPERGSIRIAGPEKNDIMLVASYLTGARDFYLVEDDEGGDVIIDPELGRDKPGKYVIIFQREDNGRTVEAVFDRPALVPSNKGPDDYGNTAPVYIEKLNNRQPDGNAEEHNRIITGLMDLILKFDKEKLYSASVIDGYDFPDTKRLKSMSQLPNGVVAQWFELGEALNAKGYADVFTQDGSLTIGAGKLINGKNNIENAVTTFFDSIEGFNHQFDEFWTTNNSTIVKGKATYRFRNGKKVLTPFIAEVLLSDDMDKIKEAKIFADLSALQ